MVVEMCVSVEEPPARSAPRGAREIFARVQRLVVAVCLTTAASTSIAAGQGLGRLSIEVVGGTSATGSNHTNSPPIVGGIVYAPLQREPSGKPCLTVSPIPQRQIINKSIFDHILLLDNHCGKEIRIRACYYKTDSCKTMAVGGYKRQQQILGIFPSADFRYSYREYVN